MNSKLLIGGLVVVVALVLGFSMKSGAEGPKVIGSTALQNAYQSTTTGSGTGYNLAPAVVTLADTGLGSPCVLGSIIPTVTAAGIITVYDATTSNVSLRAGATSTLRVLASFAASPTVGVYTFDSQCYKGLLFTSVGTQGTTTITYRGNY